MNFFDVLKQLADQPATYLRPGTTFAQLSDTSAVPAADFTSSADMIAAQINSFSSAQWGWLDVWGLLLGIQRAQNEADSSYSTRIVATVLAFVGTTPAIEIWGQFVFGQPVTVSDRTPVGYTITLPNGVTTAAINAFVVSLSRIRPAGVPFNLVQQDGGLFLDTINYTDTHRVEGSYLDDSVTAVPLVVSASTQNAQPLLPDIYLTDPGLNPSS